MDGIAMEQGGAPGAQVLSNGRLVVVIGGGGGGSARLERVVLARWSARGRPDAGALAFVREPASGREWPAGLAADGEPPDEYALGMTGGTAALRRVDGDLVTTVDVCVSPFDDVELRRVTVLNRGAADRRLEVGTRRELLPWTGRGSSAALPPSRLELEALEAPGALLVTRPVPSEDEDPLFLLQLLRRAEGAGGAGGAGRAAQGAGAPPRVEGGAGGELSLSLEVRLRPGESAQLLALTGAAATREDAEALARRYGSGEGVGAGAGAGAEPVFGAAEERVRNLLADLRIPQGWARRIPALTGQLLFGAGAAAAAAPAALTAQRQAGLEGAAPLALGWGEAAEPLAAAVAMASYWRRQAVPVDLLVLAPSALQAETLRELARAPARKWLGRTVVAAPGELAADVVARVRTGARVLFDGELAEAVAGV